MKLDKHYLIEDRIVEEIDRLSVQNKQKASKIVNALLEDGLKYRDREDKLDKIYNKLSSLSKTLNISFSLEKQMYSDFNFTNITDPSKSYALNEFLEKNRKDKYDD